MFVKSSDRYLKTLETALVCLREQKQLAERQTNTLLANALERRIKALERVTQAEGTNQEREAVKRAAMVRAEVEASEMESEGLVED